MATLQDLRNTGAGIAEGSQDALFVVTKPDTTTATPYVAASGTYPMNAWPANNATSKWLVPQLPQNDCPSGTYLWTFTFTLTAAQVSQARITGRYMNDDTCHCYLNNTQKSTTNTVYPTWNAFDITSDFVEGNNALEFRVYNDPVYDTPPDINASGLRVEFTYLYSGLDNAIMFSCNT